MILSAFLGGGSRSGFLTDALLEVAAVPLLLTSLWLILQSSFTGPAKWSLRLCLAIVMLPLLQLIPLPPLVWTALPNREIVISGFELVGSSLPWMPISVSPRATWLATLSTIPPLAIFLGTLLLDYHRRRTLTLLMLAGALLSAFTGLLQVAQGSGSALRFFEFSNPMDAVGFFANRNHFAALLYTMTPFAAAWTIVSASALESKTHRNFDTPSLAALAGSSALLIALIASQAMARSRAGIALSIVALCGAFALAFWGRGRPENKSGGLLAAVICLAIVFASQFALYRVLERFGTDSMASARASFARNTIEAAHAFMPLGSGFGSFVSVYGLFEKPADAIANIYVNRAHNDILEIWLESGLPGLMLMGLFLAWLVASGFRVWRRASSGGASIDIMLQRGAVIALVLLLAHSLVDYPLRTGTMMTVFAFACAMLVEPGIRNSGDEPARERGRRKGRSNAIRSELSIDDAQRIPSPLHENTRMGGEASSGDSEFTWPDAWIRPKAKR